MTSPSSVCSKPAHQGRRQEAIASGAGFFRSPDGRFFAQVPVGSRHEILGGLLDAVAGGMRELPSMSFPKLPRMADFAAFGEAVGRTLGWPNGTVLADYNDNRRESILTQLEDSIVASVVRRFADRIQEWPGTASELLRSLTKLVSPRDAWSARWPKSAGRLTNEPRRVAPQLRMHGVSIAFERNCNGRMITLADRNPSKE
jgi:hypothetical protein